MALKGATVGIPTLGSSSPEKRRASKIKRDKSRRQTTWVETVSRSRKYPLPSLHLRISFTDISRPRLGKWSLSRRQSHDNIQVVRTKSQAGMLRPSRLPTIYKSNSRLFIDPFEDPVPGKAQAELHMAESEKHSVVVDLPERVEVHIPSYSTEKHSVVVDIPSRFEIRLSSRVARAEPAACRFEELNDDASVHELEAVYPTAGALPEHSHSSTTVVLCEADDPTAFPTIELLHRTFTVGLKQHRPKISLSIPRSKSLQLLPDNGTPGTAAMMSPPSPPSMTPCRSLTQVRPMRHSMISPLTPIDMPRPVRPYSTISVPLFMDASDLAQATQEQVPPLPPLVYPAADMDNTPTGEPFLAHQLATEEPEECSHPSAVSEDVASTSHPSSVEEVDEEYEDGFEDMIRGMSRTTMAARINKPLPPEPQTMIPATLPPLAYRSRQIKIAQSQETLPRSRYSPAQTRKFDNFRKHGSGKSQGLDQAIEELELRLSTICEQRSQSEIRRSKTPIQVSRGLMLMQPTRPPPEIPHSGGGEVARRWRRTIVRSNSADHIIHQAKDHDDYEKKARSCEDLRRTRAVSEICERGMVDESETWYRTASERSSAVLSHSVFSDTGTDGTCQTEQSQRQEKLKDSLRAETEKECVINNVELPKAMQSSGVAAGVAETVILRIMSNLSTLKDLFATAALNKGFYNTFKRHEMYLIKTTLFKSSRAAWELREISEEIPVSPNTYLRQYSVEISTMAMLKSLILVQCESFLRPATIAGLVGTDQGRSSEIDAAFWRIWSFCRLFGSSAGGDEDLDAQIDWLDGGRLRRQKNPLTSFGIGNNDGLSKNELYDMIELWTCLHVLGQIFHGRIDEARSAGIYEGCTADNARDKELLLEEWTWYILTLGPSYILALAPGSFPTAKDLGLTTWEAPAPGAGCSRRKFFKDALTRVYEARLAEEAKTKGRRVKRTSKAPYRMTKSDRDRQHEFAQELRSQRQHSSSTCEPWAFSDERPMSVYSQVVKSLPPGTSRVPIPEHATMPKPRSSQQYTATSRPTSISTAQSDHTVSSLQSPQNPLARLTSFCALPTPDDDMPFSATGDFGPDTPIITLPETTSETDQIVDPTDRAMTHLITVLGFDPPSAKWALARSETGHGLDLQRAIDLLANPNNPNNPNTNHPRNDFQSQHQPQLYNNTKLNPQPPQLHNQNNTNNGNGNTNGNGANADPHTHSRSSSCQSINSDNPVEVESSTARPSYIRKRSPAIRGLQQRDSIATTDEMTEKEKERANIMRMREKSYRVLGIGARGGGGGGVVGLGIGVGLGSGSGSGSGSGGGGGKKFLTAAVVGRRFSRR